MPGRSYTVDTLRRLHDECPEDQLTFIVGGDMARSLPAWREPEAILELAELGVAGRDSITREEIERVLAGLGGQGRGRDFDMPPPGGSPTPARARGRAGPVLRHAAPGRLLDARARAGRRRPARALPGAGRRLGVHRGQRALRGVGRVSGGEAARAAEHPGAELARWIEGYAADVKAIDVVEVDLRGVLGYTDYFVICSGNTDRQTKAIHDRIHLGMKNDHGLLPRRVEGVAEARWILMDYLDVVVHLFTPDTREFYRLEQLWGEAPRRAIED